MVCAFSQRSGATHRDPEEEEESEKIAAGRRTSDASHEHSKEEDWCMQLWARKGARSRMGR